MLLVQQGTANVSAVLERLPCKGAAQQNRREPGNGKEISEEPKAWPVVAS